MYIPLLLLVERVPVDKVNDVVSEQVDQQLPPDQLVYGSSPSTTERRN